MKVHLPATPCDSQRLEAFFSGTLSALQEQELTQHLESCESCRLGLERQAAEPDSWREAESLLRPVPFDSPNSEPVAPRQPLQIQSVLDSLGPTDDPAMLGRIGGYEVSGVVGAGGMGVVLKAHDRSLDRIVAIKVLAPHLASSGAARKRFAREAKAAAAVLHPNVIAIHSVSNDESLPYLVMPYVKGASLQKRLDREGPLALQEILRIGAQIAAGLAAAHAQGLVHRDIKPANILLEEGVERVTITDFGLARAVDDASITHSGMIAGTPQYMSPEQARGEGVDQRSDLFSLGSVLYAICTGRPPFRAETTYGVMRRITDEEPTSIDQINPEIPQWLCGIVAKLMSKNAADRFASAAEVTELLEQCLAHVQQPAAVPLPASLVSLPPADRSFFGARRPGVLVMLGTLILTVVGMVAWQASEPPDLTGHWTGEGWGEVVLEQKQPTAYEGTYSDTVGQQQGKLKLEWSRAERRFNGTWREVTDRFGKISVRLVEGEIRGAWTTSKKSEIQPGNPKLADLTWVPLKTEPAGAKPNTGSSAIDAQSCFLCHIGEPDPIGTGKGLIATTDWALKPMEGDLEIVIGAELWYRTKRVPELKQVPLADLNKLLAEGQKIVLNAHEEVNYAAVKEVMRIVEQVKDVTVTLVQSPHPIKATKTSGEPVGAIAGKPFSLEFRLAYLKPGPNLTEMTAVGSDQKVYVAAEAVLTSQDIASARVATDSNGQLCIEFDFHAEGAKQLEKVTAQHLGKPLAILVDGKLISAPTIRGGFAGTFVMVGFFDRAEAERIAKALNANPTRLNYFTSGHSIKLASSPDGKLLAVANGNPTRILQEGGTSRLKGGWKPTVDLLDAETGKVIVSLKLTTPEEDLVLASTERNSHLEAVALAFSPTENLLAVGTSIGQVKLYNSQTGELVASLNDGAERVGDKQSPESWRNIQRAMGSVTSLGFSPDGTLLATSGVSFADFSRGFDSVDRLGRRTTGPGRLKIWEVKTRTLQQGLVGHSYAEKVAFSPDGTLLASAGRWSSEREDGAGILLWNPQNPNTGAKVRAIKVAGGGTHAFAFSPDSKLLSLDLEPYDKENQRHTTAVSMVDTLSGKTLWERAFSEWAQPTAFTPDGKSVLVLGKQSIQFLDAQTGALQRELKATDLSLQGRWEDFSLLHNSSKLVIGAVDEQEGSVEVRDVGTIGK